MFFFLGIYLLSKQKVPFNLDRVGMSEVEWETARERMIKLLLEAEYPLSAKEIARELGIDSERTVYEELKHVSKSIRRMGLKLYVEPAYCKKCGYVFKDAKIKRPSKCPKCKSQWIEPPHFIIRG